MEQLNFTTRVLGPLAAYRLEQQQVTQTLRGYSGSITQAILTGRLKRGDQMQVLLDKRMIGLAQYVILDTISLDNLTIEDARRGGFDSISDLALALKRAGYRFQPLEDYTFYRFQFSWLVEV